MFDDIRRIGEKVDNLLGTDIFPFNYPFSHTENFLQHMDKWEFAIPMKFLWLVHIDTIPSVISSQTMWNKEPSGGVQSSGGKGEATQSNGWDINQGKSEITRKTYMDTGNGNGCILAQGVVLPGENYEVKDIPISNNMGFLPGKVGGNKSASPPLQIQFRETNRSFPDLVLRPWIYIASHMGLVARPPTDTARAIKTNISIVQLGKTYAQIPLVERKVWHFYNCVPVSIDGKELTYDAAEIQLYSTSWNYTHYSIESLPNTDMDAYMSKEGFQKFVKDMANKLLAKSRFFKKLNKKLAKVERFVDKATKIKKKVDKVLGFLGGLGKPKTTAGGNRENTSSRGRRADQGFVSDTTDN
tara:strand:- start:356 stop:1423 length:1068 start_codon:yes stop_codon:yes gene_type:complete